MASQTTIHRAVAAGLSAGVCMALPMAGYAVAGAVDGMVQDLVSASAVPFVVGAAAGIGLVSISVAVLDRTSEPDEEADLSHVEDGGAHRFGVHNSTSHTGLFSRGGAPAGVPVISRAQDALPEEEAWADIDATFAGDSPFSCDPLSSKDIYQIALEELARASSPRSQAAASPQAGSQSGTSVPGAPAITAVMSVAAPSQATSVFLAAAAAQAAETARERDRDADAAQAALATLGTPTPMKSVPASVAERIDVVEPRQVAASAEPNPSVASQQPAPVEHRAAHMAAPASFEGHESMWAAALEILDEKPAATEAALTAERAQAVAEGKRETALHGHVNRLVSEELDRARSKSVRRSSREFLRVIQGGTMSMPVLTAEA